MTRKEKILENIDVRNGTGLEIGALDSPIVTKKDGDIYYADLLKTDGLINLFEKDENVKKEKIVNVDYAIGVNGPKKTIKNKKFDYVIASHVIEHVPDPVRWFADIHHLLDEGGILSLAVPDKRFTFDICRNVSRPAEIIGAHLDKFTRPSSGAMYDFATESRKDIESKTVWSNPKEDFTMNKHYWTRDEAFKKCIESLIPAFFGSCHIFVFTPYSFFEIIKRLIEHGLFDFEVEGFCDTEVGDMEFFVRFKKVSKTNKKKQLATMPVIEKDESVLELQKKIDELQTEIKKILGSKSWRYTKALKKVSTKVKKKSR